MAWAALGGNNSYNMGELTFSKEKRNEPHIY